jgi:hypothetical protein
MEKIGIDVMTQCLIMKGKGLRDEQADKNTDCELAKAACAYALGAPEITIPLGPQTIISHRVYPYALHQFRLCETYRQDLVMACTYLMHEIARLDRAEALSAAAEAKADEELRALLGRINDTDIKVQPEPQPPIETPQPLAAKAYAPPPPPPALKEAIRKSPGAKVIQLGDRAIKRGKIGMRNLRGNLHSMFSFSVA